MVWHSANGAASSVVNVMKQSGCEIPAWMNDLPKLTKRDKRRIRQKMVQRKDVDAESRLPTKGGKSGKFKAPKKSTKASDSLQA
jgi:hypothetical protein